MRSAIRLSWRARSAMEVRPQRSAAVERATSKNTLPVTGEKFSMQRLSTGATQSPPMKLS